MGQNYVGGGEGKGTVTALVLAAFALYLILWVGWAWYFWPLKALGVCLAIFAAQVIWHNVQVIFGFGHGNPHVS